MGEAGDQGTGAVSAAARRVFSSLDTHNYRLFFAANLITHTGEWMQNMAEAWLVLRLTDNGAAVGAVFAFRFLPVLLFGLWGGAIADRFDRQRLLIATSVLSALLALGLWAVVLTDVVQVWMVYALAVGLGLVTVVEQPAMHAFVEEMVGHEKLANAVALNSSVANSARITGPALAGLLIAGFGESWVFFVNAITFVAVVLALVLMRSDELDKVHAPAELPRVREGLRYSWSLREMRATLLLVGVVGTLVYNFPTFLTLLARETFHGDAGLAGLLMAVLGLGTIIGGLAAAHQAAPTPRTVLAAAVALGGAVTVLSLIGSEALTIVWLVPTGVAVLFFGTTSNAHMQVSSAPEFRGRVMSLYSIETLGMTVVGGPLMGWICQQWSPHVSLAVAGLATLSVTGGLALRRRRAVAIVPAAAPVAVAD